MSTPPPQAVDPRQTERRVAVNSGLLLAAFAVQSLVSLVVIGLVARYLGQAGLGRYAYVVSFIELFVVFVDLGMSRIQVRETSRDLPGAGRYASAILTLRILFSLVMMVVVAVIAARSGDPELWLATMVFFVAQALYLLGDVYGSIVQGFQRMEQQFWGITISQIALLVLTVVVMVADAGLVALFGARLVANTIYLLYLWFVTRQRFARAHVFWSVLPAIPVWLAGRLATPQPGTADRASGDRWQDARLTWRMFVDSLPVGISLALRSFIWRGGVVLTVFWLGQAEGDLANGLLYGPLRVVQQMRILPAAFAGAMLPVFSRRAAARPEQFDVAFIKSVKLFTAISLLLILAFLFMADPIVLLLLGTSVDLAGAAEVLRVLGLVTFLFFFNWLYGVTLVAQDRQRLESLGLVLGLAAGLLIASWGIPRYGALGVSVAILAAEGVPFVIGTIAMWPHFHWNRTWRSLAKIVLSCLLSGAVFAAGTMLWRSVIGPALGLGGTADALVQSVVVGSLGLAVFVIALWLLHTFDDDEMDAIRSMLRLQRRAAS